MLRVLAFLLFFAATGASGEAPRIGVVTLHGKGGLPDGAIHELALYLGERYLVANLEMPWSFRRDYDVDVGAATTQVESALAELRAKGAAKVFVAGHSQGGVFALYVAGRIPMDGVIAIAPGGDVANPTLQQQVAESRSRAAALVADGKGTERTRFVDWQGARGVSPVITSAAVYLTWFDPDGAMNELAAIRRLDPKMPVLFVVPTNDTPALLRAKPRMVAALPRNALTKVYEPDTNHMRAPTDAREEIARWIAEVARR